MPTNVIRELKWRGLIQDSTDLEDLENLLSVPQSVYAGFDPTAPSLQLGNLVALITLARFVKCGHKAIIVLGGATALIGDPSGKTAERQLLPEEIVADNIQKISQQIVVVFDNLNVPKEQLLILNNADWLKKLDVISFLRDVGKHFSVNAMLNRDAVRLRLEREGQGISFTEFSYVTLQAYDFLYLAKTFNCRLQIGGSDQWGNITAGTELVRKLTGKQAFGLTHPLVTDARGNKLGKTAESTIWLDKDRTSPYKLYQYLLNTADEDVIRFLKFLTFQSKEEIQVCEESVQSEPEKRFAQKKLAQEVTKIVHGTDGLRQAEKITNALFSQKYEELSESEFSDAIREFGLLKISAKKQNDCFKIDLVASLVETGLASSKSNARDLIKSGAVKMNGKLVTEFEIPIEKLSPLFGKYIVISKGARYRSVLELTI
ncbi:MAG: tyrosine--tRNA ligase [Deltaproteobacteria bacterium]|nr:tyrosine--tRNA ligase [Deltaproteobacteria bacterium]